jgi:hypothetical protein
MITQEQLKEVLFYDAKTGIFTWRIWSNHRFPQGSEAGTINMTGYVHIGYRRVYYKAHNLAWLYVAGQFPSKIIDHINGDKADNRFENLRLVTSRQNCQNAKCHRAGRLVGACPNKGNITKPWRSQIYVNGKTRNLGHFKTALEAHSAYIDALKEIGAEVV